MKNNEKNEVGDRVVLEYTNGRVGLSSGYQ